MSPWGWREGRGAWYYDKAAFHGLGRGDWYRDDGVEGELCCLPSSMLPRVAPRPAPHYNRACAPGGLAHGRIAAAGAHQASDPQRGGREVSSTRTLAAYLSGLKFEDLPQEVVEKGKLAILDAVGNCIGGYPLALSRTFLDVAEGLGGGRPEATLIGDGGRVSAPAAAFGNAALTTMLDYCDYTRSESGRCATWLGAMAVPAALAAGELRGISGRELVAGVVAGYEGAARIVHSMDMTLEQSQKVGGETLSVFAAVCAAGRALGLDEDEMLSAVGMAGIYTPCARLVQVGGRRGPHTQEGHQAGLGLDVHDRDLRRGLGPARASGCSRRTTSWTATRAYPGWWAWTSSTRRG